MEWALVGIAVAPAVVLDAAIAVAGTVFAIGNATYVADPDHASTPKWWVNGYIFGGINLALSGLWLYLGQQANKEHRPIFHGVALTHLAIGAFDIGMAVWGSREPEQPDLAVKVQPLLMTDQEGNLAFGAGVAVVGW